jgi:hypothetical protein
VVLVLDERYVEGLAEGCPNRIGEDDPDEELLFPDLWDDETQQNVVIASLQADCEVRAGRPSGQAFINTARGILAAGGGQRRGGKCGPLGSRPN